MYRIKVKAKWMNQKHVKKLSKKDQLMLDEELAFKLQAEEEEEEEEEERLAREKAQQIEETTNKSSTKEFHVYLSEKHKRMVEESSKKAEEEIAQESSSKRAGTELEQESIKKQNVDEDKETTELQRLIEVVLDKEEIAIDAIPLENKPSSIVDYKIHKEGKKTYYQIIRADGSSKMYLVFSYMLKSFDRKDLETLLKLVKAKHGSTRPEAGYERVLWDDLKTMFDLDVEDQDATYKHSYAGIKEISLTPTIITDMLNKKLQCDHFSKMGKIIGIKRLHDDLEVTTAMVCVTATKLKLVLFINPNAKYAK
ncbi:hypothetical protein Tco_1187277 [Tanacetum coccineum]